MRQSVSERYGASVVAMRESGKTLAQIGVRYGITKERVRQILIEKRGTTKMMNFTTVAKVASTVGCTPNALRKKLEESEIPLVRVGEWLTVQSSNLGKVLALAKTFRSPSCRVCGKPVPAERRFYCSASCNSRWGNRRAYSSPERRARIIAANRNWQKKNPEKVRKIRLRFYEKQRQTRYRTQMYVITKDYGKMKANTLFRILPGRSAPGFCNAEQNGKAHRVPLSLVRATTPSSV